MIRGKIWVGFFRGKALSRWHEIKLLNDDLSLNDLFENDK